MTSFPCLVGSRSLSPRRKKQRGIKTNKLERSQDGPTLERRPDSKGCETHELCSK